MREIKFRAKEELTECTYGNQKFVYGYYYNNCDYGVNKDVIVDQDGKHIDVDGFTVGQFTGLTDKNGVDIYEGDILKVELFSKPYQITFGKSEKWGAAFCVQSHNSITFLNKSWSDTSEVVGNIHDNPEQLLK